MSFYDLIRHYGCWLHRCCYSRYTVIGRENIPTDGALILAPNHTSAIQDAISAVDAVQQGVVFVGRAQMFKNPILARCCRFFKIMPIGRMRDGVDAVRGNDKTFEQAVRVMKSGTPFAIFAEGTMRSKHSLLPLVKGIFRIALQAHDELQNAAVPVYILPMGFDYDDFFYFGDRTTVRIGRPINVSAFVAAHPDMDRPHLINALQAELTRRLKPLFRFIHDDEHYAEKHRLHFASRPIDHRPLRWSAFVLGLPFFLLAGLVCWPAWLMEVYVRFGITDHGFDRTFRYLTGFVCGLLTLGLFLPFWIYCIHYLNNARRLFGYQPGYQELMP